jgi:gas vesicle protein
MENSNNSGKLIGGLILGAAIGGALGILFAPDKGTRTRTKLVNEGKDLADDLTNAVSDKLDDFLGDLKRELKSFKEKAREYAFDGKK